MPYKKFFRAVLFVLVMFTFSVTTTGCDVIGAATGFISKVFDGIGKVFTKVKEAVKPVTDVINQGKQIYSNVKDSVSAVKTAVTSATSGSNTIPSKNSDGTGTTGTTAAKEPAKVASTPTATAANVAEIIAKKKTEIAAQIKTYEEKIKSFNTIISSVPKEAQTKFVAARDEMVKAIDGMKNVKLEDPKSDLTKIDTSIKSADKTVQDMVKMAETAKSGFTAAVQSAEDVIQSIVKAGGPAFVALQSLFEGCSSSTTPAKTDPAQPSTTTTTADNNRAQEAALGLPADVIKKANEVGYANFAKDLKSLSPTMPDMCGNYLETFRSNESIFALNDCKVVSRNNYFTSTDLEGVKARQEELKVLHEKYIQLIEAKKTDKNLCDVFGLTIESCAQAITAKKKDLAETWTDYRANYNQMKQANADATKERVEELTAKVDKLQKEYTALGTDPANCEKASAIAVELKAAEKELPDVKARYEAIQYVTKNLG